MVLTYGQVLTTESEETTSSIINLIISTQELNLYAVHKLFIALKNNIGQVNKIYKFIGRISKSCHLCYW